MTRLRLMIGVALLAMPVFAGQAYAQPTPEQPASPTAPASSAPPPIPPTPRPANQYDATIHQQAQTGNLDHSPPPPPPVDPNALPSLEQQVAMGWVTQNEADRAIGQYQQTNERLTTRLQRETRQLQSFAANSVDGLIENAQSLGVSSVQLGATNANDLSDPNFSTRAAEGAIAIVRKNLEAERNFGNTYRPVMQEMFGAMDAAAAQYAEALRRNGKAPPDVIARVEKDARDFHNRTRLALERILNEHDQKIREAERILNERETQIKQKVKEAIEKLIAKNGTDPKKWPAPPPPPARKPGDFSYVEIGTGTTPNPKPQPDAPPKPDNPKNLPALGGKTPVTPSATPNAAPFSTGKSIVPSKKGTIPMADPYAGLRVPSESGGTGVASQPSSAKAPASNAPGSASGNSAKPTTPPKQAQIDPTKIPQMKLPEERVPLGLSPKSKNPLALTTQVPGQLNPRGDKSKSGSGGNATDSALAGAAAATQAGKQPPSKSPIHGFGKDIRIDPDYLMQLAEAQSKAQAKKPNLSPKEKSDIQTILDKLPKNKDGSIDTGGAYQALIKGLPKGLKDLFAPAPTGKASASAVGSAGNAAAAAAQRVPATVAAQRPAEPFVQPRQPGGPGYPLAPHRNGTASQHGAAQGQWTAGDSFGAAAIAAAAAATATPPDAVDIARERIEAQNNAAMEAWNRRAAEVYYDENGVIHSVPRDRPVNNYRPSPTPLRPVDNSAWGRFERGLDSISILDLESIYAGWDINTAPFGSAGAATPSSAGSVGPSSAGNSLRLDWYLPPSGYMSTELAAQQANGSMYGTGAWMGVPTNWGGLDLASDPIRVSGSPRSPTGSYGDMLSRYNLGAGFNPNDPFGDNSYWQTQPLAESAPDLARQLYGPLWSDRPYSLSFDPQGIYGRESGGNLVASLLDDQIQQLTRLHANDFGGLSQLLAQPFNVILTWGAGAFDLDLHLTGPSGAGSTVRFHIFYAARGSQTVFPFAQLIKDCICNSGSEVILTSRLVQGGVYRISAYNFGNQSASSTNLANAAQAQLQIVRGGRAVAQGNGTTIVGGHVIYTGRPPTGQPGNTWVAVEINAANGRITAPAAIVQSGSSNNVR